MYIYIMFHSHVTYIYIHTLVLRMTYSRPPVCTDRITQLPIAVGTLYFFYSQGKRAYLDSRFQRVWRNGCICNPAILFYILTQLIVCMSKGIGYIYKNECLSKLKHYNTETILPMLLNATCLFDVVLPMNDEQRTKSTSPSQ